VTLLAKAMLEKKVQASRTVNKSERG
jgi:hypothetical protein